MKLLGLRGAAADNTGTPNAGRNGYAPPEEQRVLPAEQVSYQQALDVVTIFQSASARLVTE